MNGLLARVRDVFVDVPPQASALRAERAIADALPWTGVHVPRAVAAAPAAPGGSIEQPTLVVLCRLARGRATAAAVALALARVCGANCAMAAAVTVAEQPFAPGLGLPGAHRVAARVRARGGHAAAAGRLVWLPDRRVAAASDFVLHDPAGAAAAASADLGRAVLASGVPGVLAVPYARTAALDRVLAWHDGIVVVREPDAPVGVIERVVESLGALGRPVVCVSPLSRTEAALALAGLRASPCVLDAVARLALGAASGGRAG
jgi:hypothetical protein